MEFGFWILDFGFWILGFGFWILDFGFWILDLGFLILDFGVWILDFGFWISLVFVLFVAAPNGAVWILDFGVWILEFGFWILDFGLDEALLDIVWILHKIFPCHADSGRRIYLYGIYMNVPHTKTCCFENEEVSGFGENSHFCRKRILAKLLYIFLMICRIL